MKEKITILNVLSITGILLLSGCSSLKMKNPSTYLTQQATPSVRILEFGSQENENPGLNILAHQVLGKPKKSKTELSQMSKASKPHISYYPDEDPLSVEMRDSAVVKKIIESWINKTDISLSRSDFADFAEALDKQLLRTSLDANVQNKISVARTNGQISFDDVLLRYAKAYIQGNFVLRDGTKLAKPSGSISFKDGAINASTDNDTLVGLTTVFFEAFYEFIFPTPVLADIGAIISYSQAPQDTGKNDSDNKRLYAMLYHQERTNNYFSDTNSVPTVEKENLFPVEQIVSDGNSGISEKELKAIRYVSGILSEGSKSLSSVAFKNLGGIGVSFLGFVKLSLGDNDAVGKLVETSFAVFTRRSLENGLYRFFSSYKLGTNTGTDQLLYNIPSK